MKIDQNLRGELKSLSAVDQPGSQNYISSNEAHGGETLALEIAL
ncbi:MAG: hypothetical protein ACI9EW_002750, partial [Cellvibrionaceae bacterium]